ncbi:MAG: hypothetical protein K0S23_2752 [Fluviicola sp.]|jgi:hypothetical protein|uniref:hypothetical protein n=1 Tax=Fluviicola sp. TaxID=1917219 RepID=UPI00261851C2|nr:hypothetical protein [Fluviicola sp.]MDF3028445.1 hypothetical protein [Fluviicola sp.]
MKKLIHIDNYESFYLDYLEGTLSEEERIAFEEFLAAHPELRVDEELLILDEAPEKLDPLQKLLLKKEDLTFVSGENLDYFAIGRIEQVLSAKEDTLFDTYLAANPEAQKLLAAYRETRLQASVVSYPNKEDLKEKEIRLVPWKLIAGITSAAAVLLLFFQLGLGTGTTEKDPTVMAQHRKLNSNTHSADKKSVELEPATNSIPENNTVVAQRSKPDSNQNPPIHSERDPKQKVKNTEDRILPVQPETDKNLIGEKSPHHPTILPQVKDNKQPVAPTLDEEVNKAPSKDLASNAGGSNMKNPIPIITNTISEKTKTPVDFKTGKATETEKGGFFIKIGKFEVSHKSSKRK